MRTLPAAPPPPPPLLAPDSPVVAPPALLERANAVNPSGTRYTEEQLVQSLMSYEASGAKAALSHFGKGHGPLRRLVKLFGLVPAMIRDTKSSTREQQMADILFRDFNIGTLAVGHDHTFRAEARLVVDRNTARLPCRATKGDAAS